MSSGPHVVLPPDHNNHPPPVGGANNNNSLGAMATLPTSFLDDPAGYLASIASQNPSRQALGKLANPIAAFIAQGQGQGVVIGATNTTAPPADAGAGGGGDGNNSNTPPVSQIAGLYLQAASKQLMGDVPVGDMEQEMFRAQQQYEILEAISVAATQCQPRSAISNSGILPTLAHLMLNSTMGPASAAAGNNMAGGSTTAGGGGGASILQHAHVEFLHCSILAEQYRYAERLVENSWPRPTSMVSSKQVLRYFFLRGVVHLGCDHYRLAHRCFWTCLTVPSEISSKIAIAAWKKLVLVQCLLQSKTTPALKPTGDWAGFGGGGGGGGAMNSLGFTEANSIMSPPAASSKGASGGSSGGGDATTMATTTLPKTMPNCVGRFLMSYRDAGTKSGQERSRQRQQQQQQPQGSSLLGARDRNQPPTQQQQQQQPESLNPISCYMDVSKAFYTRNQTKMAELEQEYHQTFSEDGNLGLLHQCHTKLIHMQVAHLSRVYSVVPLTKLAETLVPAVQEGTTTTTTTNAEDARIRRATMMLCQAQIPCDIQEDGMVVFPSEEDDDDYDDDIDHDEDHPSLSLSDLSEWMSLMERIQKLDVGMATNNKYQALLRKDTGSDKAAAAAAMGPRGVEDL